MGRRGSIPGADDRRADDPTAVILDGRTVRSAPASEARAGYNGHERHNWRGTPSVTCSRFMARPRTSRRPHVATPAQAVQAVTGDHVAVAVVDQRHRRRPKPITSSGRRQSTQTHRWGASTSASGARSRMCHLPLRKGVESHGAGARRRSMSPTMAQRIIAAEDEPRCSWSVLTRRPCPTRRTAAR
jgi:hypothetical protein